MVRNKKHLEGLLDIIKQVCNEEENGWFKMKLTKEIIENESNSQFEIENGKIDEIHEHFFMAIIKKQAEEFYSAFSYKDQKNQLIDDFIKMEYARRKNDFENFCLTMYQQVELIIGYVYKKETIYLKVDEEKNKVIRESDNYKVCNFLAKSKDQDHIDKLYKNDPLKWSFNKKFRSVILFKYMEKRTSYFDLSMIEKICDLANYLSLGRNLVHRGAIVFENQEEKLSEIQNDPQRFYLRFLGFLEEFVSLLNSKSSARLRTA